MKLFSFNLIAALLLLAPALAANTAPSASSMAAGVNEGDILEFYAPGVLTNATDPESDPLTAVLISGPASGALTFNSDGSFSYTPNAGFSGADSFTFAAFDGEFQSAPASVDITVISTNDPPVATPMSYIVAEDTVLGVPAPGVLAGASDPDSPLLTATLVTGPANGTVILNADGSFDYSPNANFNGTDSFEFAAHDGALSSSPATVTITVLPVNDEPTGGAASYVLDEDTMLDVPAPGLMALCHDADNEPMTIAITRDVGCGNLIVNADGSFNYVPQSDFCGTDSFEYTVSDGQATVGAWVVTLDVQAINDAPVSNADSYTLAEDGMLKVETGGLLANDSDAEGDTMRAVAVSLPAHGTLTLNTDGTFSYTPEADYNGSDSFSYFAEDAVMQGAAVAVTLTIVALNDAPKFTHAGDVTTLEDSGAQSYAWASAISAGPANEGWQQVRFVASIDNSCDLFEVPPSVDAMGVLSFAPKADKWGTATVTIYLADDGGAASNQESDRTPATTFLIIVQAMNDKPSFIPGGNVSVLEDCGEQNIAWAGAISSGMGNAPQPLAFVIVGNSNPALFASQPAIDESGTLTFMPAADAHGQARIDVMLSERLISVNLDAGEQSEVQSFTIFVNAVNDAPEFSAGGDVAVRGDSSVVMMNWATGISAGPADEQGQQLMFRTLSVDNPGLFESQPMLDSAGTLYFKPAKNARGVARVMIMLDDNGGTAGGGLCTSAPYSFNLQVEPEGVEETSGSCSAGEGGMPWYLWLAAPLAAIGVLRRRRVAA